MCNMAILVVEFSRERYKIRKFFWLKINCSQMKLPNLENWSIGKLTKSAKIGRSKWFFYVKNHWNLSDFFIERYKFRSPFFDNDIFWWYQFLNYFIFWNDVQFSTARHYSNYHNFIWLQLIFSQKPFFEKLHNRYCHTKCLLCNKA